MSKLGRRSFLSAFWGALVLWAGRGAAQPPLAFNRTSLVIENGKGRHKFDVDLALTDVQQSRGLMFRRKMAPDAGMLFDYKYPQVITMWMKNTLIPLDMVFIAADGRISHIAQRTVPYSQTVISSRGRARAVLEINGGTAQRLGIKPGDKVIHPMFGTGAE